MLDTCATSFVKLPSLTLCMQQWDLVSRSKRVNGIDGVDIFPVLKKGQEEYIILVLQTRPPVGGLCLEFPAGSLSLTFLPSEA